MTLPIKHLTITGGMYRGRKLHAPEHVRPTSQRAREAIMSKLTSLWGGPVQGYIADVCAGAGALGLELLSRGAQHASFVDIDTRSVKENLALLKVPSSTYDLIQQDARTIMPTWRHHEPLDVLMTDPPYNVTPLPKWVSAWYPWVKKNHTIVCIEQETEHVCRNLEGLTLLQEAQYGRATWTLWQKE